MSDCGGHDHCQRDELLARAEAALQERDEARERHIAGLAATRGRIKSLKHDRSRLRSQVRDLTIRAEAAEQLLQQVAEHDHDGSYGIAGAVRNYFDVRAASAGREETGGGD